MESSAMSLEERVQDLLRHRIAPELELDGSAIEVTEVFNGIASVRLGDICSSCPATLMTVLTQLESELKRHMPEIELLEAVR